MRLIADSTRLATFGRGYFIPFRMPPRALLRIGSWGPAPRAAATKLVTIPLSAILALSTSRIILHAYGLSAYGAFALVVALPALLPSRDLGLGARVTDVVARRGSVRTDELEAVLAAAVGRILRLAAAAVGLLIGVQVTIGWHLLLGAGMRGVPETAVTAAMALFVLALPGGIANSMLWGLRRNDLIALQALALTLGTLLAVALAAAVGGPIWLGLVAAMFSNAIVQWGTFALVAKHLRISGAALLLTALRPPSQSFARWAVPMFLITTSTAVGYQTDRLVLSHVGGARDVAGYSVIAQFFLPLWGVISSAGYTLWAKYAVDREADGIERAHFYRTVSAFAAFGAVAGLLLIAAGPLLTSTVLGVHSSYTTAAAFGLLLLAQSAGLPLGMLLTDPRGLRSQAGMFVTMAVSNLALSVWWARDFGIAGPVFASAATYGCIVLAPSALLVKRYLRPARVRGVMPESSADGRPVAEA